MDEVSNQIKKILCDAEGRPLLKKEIFEELQASYGYEGSERKVERVLGSLKEEGIAEQVPARVTRKRRIFTAIGWVHFSAIVKKGTESKTNHDKIRASHTEAIKEKVIKPWIEQLPDIYIDGLYKIVVYKEESLFQKFGSMYYDKLEVEDKLLFEDFKKHVSFYPSPFELLEKLREKTIDELDSLSSRFDGGEYKIKDIKKFELVCNHPVKATRYNNYFPPDHCPSKAFFDLMKLKIIDDYLKETPLRLGSEILLGTYYERLYEIVKNKNDGIPSQIKDGVYTIHNIQFEYLGQHRRNRDISLEIKSVLDEMVIYCLNPSKEYQSAGVEIAKKLVELYEIKEQMIKVLQQHLERDIFAGECGYTIP